MLAGVEDSPCQARSAAYLVRVAILGAAMLGACGGSSATSESAATDRPAQASPAANVVASGEDVSSQFEVTGEGAGYLLWWFDHDGVHSASKRSEVPEQYREHVRVQPVQVGQHPLDPEHILVADMRQAANSGGYPVRKLSRDSFDRVVEQMTTAGTGTAGQGNAAPTVANANTDLAQGEPQHSGASAPGSDGNVYVYSASWCGACRQAKAYLHQRGVNYIERDVERDPGAQAEMMRKARAQGLSPTGIPVLDIRGRILLGFSAQAVDQALAATATAH